MTNEDELDLLTKSSRDVTSGVVTAVISLTYSLSFAALIFSGPLTDGLSRGISALLIGTGITALAVAMLSSFRFAISGPDGNACAVMASIAAGIALDLSTSVSPEVAVNNVLYLLAFSTFITGIFLATLGTVRAGRWIRFVPYPVVGGLIAAAGALTVLGAGRVIIGVPITLSTLGAVAEPMARNQMLTGLAWTALLLVVLPRVKSPMALPLVQAAGLLAFHGVLLAVGMSNEDARAQGWLFAAPTDTRPWMPWNTSGFAQTEWWLLLRRAGDIGTLVLVTTLTVLINATGLEAETRTDTNLDRELAVQGAANMMAPLFGGFLGYLSMNRSLMNFRLGSTGRASGVIFALFAFALAFSGTAFVGYLPRALLGGLLLYFGIVLLRKWLIATRLQLPISEYVTLVMILTVTVLFGFGYGLILGVLAGCVMFAVSYSKVRVIKFSFTGKEFRSCHERSAEDKALLTRNGDDIRVFVLQGFIFFGMADRLYRSIMDTSFPANGIKTRFVVLDLNLVYGMDASAIASFKKISYSTRTAGAHLVITGMRNNQEAEWRDSGDDDLLAIHYFSGLDAGAEWCESNVIQKHRESDSAASEALHDWLHAEVGDAAPILIDYMTRRELVPGEVLCRQDEPAEDMFFIESGRVAIELAVPGGPARRLRTLGAKTILGEMGLYRSARRSADVVVQEAGVAYGLSLAALREIESAHPHAAARFHALVVRTVADRLDFSNGMVAALQR